LIPVLILHGLEGTLPSLVTPEVAHDFVYVDDVIEAYLLAANIPNQEPGAVYNVGTGIQVTIHQAVDIVRGIMAVQAEPEWGSMENRNWDTNTWVADSSLIKKNLGWHPKYNFETGFNETVAWFRDSPALLKMYKTAMIKQ
jgi:nucleoside-diphosphate-sugar epimerase